MEWGNNKKWQWWRNNTPPIHQPHEPLLVGWTVAGTMMRTMKMHKRRMSGGNGEAMRRRRTAQETMSASLGPEVGLFVFYFISHLIFLLLTDIFRFYFFNYCQWWEEEMTKKMMRAWQGDEGQWWKHTQWGCQGDGQEMAGRDNHGWGWGDDNDTGKQGQRDKTIHHCYEPLLAGWMGSVLTSEEGDKRVGEGYTPPTTWHPSSQFARGIFIMYSITS
jgi:hypothetical protein